MHQRADHGQVVGSSLAPEHFVRPIASDEHVEPSFARPSREEQSPHGVKVVKRRFGEPARLRQRLDEILSCASRRAARPGYKVARDRGGFVPFAIPGEPGVQGERRDPFAQEREQGCRVHPSRERERHASGREPTAGPLEEGGRSNGPRVALHCGTPRREEPRAGDAGLVHPLLLAERSLYSVRVETNVPAMNERSATILRDH